MNKIGFRETERLFVVLILSSVSLDAIWGFVDNSGTAAWINSLLGMVFAALAVIFISTTLKNDNLRTAIANIFASRRGGFLMLILLIITVLNASSRMDVFVEATSEYVLSEAPRKFILILFGACVFTAVHVGLEAITRYSLVFFAVFALLSAIILLSSATETDIINLCPLLGKGNFVNVANMLYIFSDIIYFYLISDAVSNRKKTRMIPVKAIITGGVITSIFSFFYTLCVPYPVSSWFRYPIYRLASLSNSSVIFQRLDGLVFFIWIFMGFISVSALTFFATVIFGKIFKLKDIRALSAPFTFLVFLLALRPVVPKELIRQIMSAFTFGGLPAFCLIYRIKSRGRKNA